MRRAGIVSLLSLALGPLAWCVALGALVGGDPMLALEIGIVTLAALWGMLIAGELARSHRLAMALATTAQEAVRFGVPIRVTPELGLDAVVVGFIRPRIYVGSEMLVALSDEEIRAVVLHEDHHRRTRAPVRAAALGAWLRMFGRSHRIRLVLLDRLADLESLADADAMRRGASARSIARALLKGEASPQPASFAYAAERRVARLLDHAEGDETAATPGRLPYEWLPVIVVAVATVGCHAGF